MGEQQKQVIVLGVEVAAGDQHTGRHVAAGLWQILDHLPRELWPTFIRGYVSFGDESIMVAAAAYPQIAACVGMTDCQMPF